MTWTSRSPPFLSSAPWLVSHIKAPLLESFENINNKIISQFGTYRLLRLSFFFFFFSLVWSRRLEVMFVSHLWCSNPWKIGFFFFVFHDIFFYGFSSSELHFILVKIGFKTDDSTWLLFVPLFSDRRLSTVEQRVSRRHHAYIKRVTKHDWWDWSMRTAVKKSCNESNLRKSTADSLWPWVQE